MYLKNKLLHADIAECIKKNFSRSEYGRKVLKIYQNTVCHIFARKFRFLLKLDRHR